MMINKINKKGSFLSDNIVYMSALFVIGIVVFIVFYIWNEFITSFNATGYNPAIGQEVGARFTSAFLMYDNLMVLIAIFLLIVIIISFNQLRTNSFFFIFVLWFGAINGLIGYFFNYMFQEFVSHTTFDAIRASFPKVIFICTNLHWFGLLAIIVGSIVAFSKKDEGGLPPIA